MMPVVGWMAGRTVSHYIAAYDHWVAFLLLTFIGGKMIYEAVRQKESVNHSDPTMGFGLIVLSVATSIDALAVGLGFAVLNVGIIYPSIVIGIVAFFMTVVGMTFGDTLGRIGGKRIEIVGGFILIGIGLKIVLEHLM
jgi:putative Mn2+ efflux pump MntP